MYVKQERHRNPHIFCFICGIISSTVSSLTLFSLTRSNVECEDNYTCLSIRFSISLFFATSLSLSLSLSAH